MITDQEAVRNMVLTLPALISGRDKQFRQVPLYFV